IIYSLPTVKELGAKHYVINLCTDPGSWLFGGRTISFNTARALAPLLLSQSYIKRVTITASNLPLEFLDQPMEGIDFKLDTFRLHEPNKHHLAICHALAFGVHLNLFEQWLHVETKEAEKDYIVVSLTPRYRSLTKEFWLEVFAGLDNVIVLGIPEEFHCVAGIRAEFVTCSDFLEIAKIIKGSCLFIGNPSLAYAIAEGLKVPRIVELPAEFQNAYPIGRTGYVVPHSILEARNLIDTLLSDSSVTDMRYQNQTLSLAVANLEEMTRQRDSLETHARNLDEARQHMETHIRELEALIQHKDEELKRLREGEAWLQETMKIKDNVIERSDEELKRLKEGEAWLQETMKVKDSEIERLKLCEQEVRKELDNILSSESWRITERLKVLGSVFRRALRR